MANNMFKEFCGGKLDLWYKLAYKTLLVFASKHLKQDQDAMMEHQVDL